jgi:hypothetical protein
MRIQSKKAGIIIGLLLTVYLFWGINRPNRLLFSNLEINDVWDLVASLVVIALGASIFYAFRRKDRIPFLITTIYIRVFRRVTECPPGLKFSVAAANV